MKNDSNSNNNINISSNSHNKNNYNNNERVAVRAADCSLSSSIDLKFSNYYKKFYPNKTKDNNNSIKTMSGSSDNRAAAAAATTTTTTTATATATTKSNPTSSTKSTIVTNINCSDTSNHNISSSTGKAHHRQSSTQTRTSAVTTSTKMTNSTNINNSTIAKISNSAYSTSNSAMHKVCHENVKSKQVEEASLTTKVFHKSSTYNNVMEHESNYLNESTSNNSQTMDSARLNVDSKLFRHSASANNLCQKKSSLLNVEMSSSSAKYLRKKAKKEAKKAKSKHQENVEQLRMLVDYLHNSKPLSLSLEAEEIELARSFKLNSKLCDECLSANEFPTHQNQFAPIETDLEAAPSFEAIRCHRCRRPIERPESTLSHFSDSAITNSDQDSNDDNNKPREEQQHASKWQSKMLKYRQVDDILDKFLAKQRGNIVARAARRGSVFQPKLLFVSFKKDNKLEDISKFAKCLPMRSWTSELFLASNESTELLDPAVKRELLSNYSYEDFRHIITPELSHFSNNIESMLAMNDKRRKSLSTPGRKQRIRFRKFSQVGSDKMWDVDRLQQKNRKIYQERLQVIRSGPNRSSACSDSSGLNMDDKNMEGFDSMVENTGTDSAEYEGSDSQLNDDYEDGSTRINHNLDTLDARTIAVEMTLISKDLLLAIDHLELARILLEPHLVDTKNCPNIVILLDFDRRIYHLLITQIVSRSDVEDRVEVIAKLIDVAIILNELKNYFSLNSAISALYSPPIARLNSTWTSLKKRYISKYDALVKLSNQVMTTYDLTDLEETPTSDDKEKEMNLRQMIDSCCIPQFELIVNQMKKSILECMRTKFNPFPLQSTPLSSQHTSKTSPLEDGDQNSNGRARTGAWTNPQNLAVWIDHEVNSLIQELETKSAQHKDKKRRSAKWLRGNRRNSSHSNDSSSKKNDSGIGGITKSSSYASLSPPIDDPPSSPSLWSRLLSKKHKNKSKQVVNAESRKSSLSDNLISDINSKDNHDLISQQEEIKPTTTIQVITPENIHAQVSRSESYHYLLSDISTENKKYILNLIQSWLLELHEKMDVTLSALNDSSKNKDKSPCDAREFLLMQAYKPLRECLVLSLQTEPLTKDKGVGHDQFSSTISSSEPVAVGSDVLETTRL